jgi:catechol 2,3-dioxygenase-like lactoylglutathione lyase family enzyme
MSLSRYRVNPDVAVSDMDRARDFYERMLGLSDGTETPDGGRTYPCKSDTQLHVYPSREHAGRTTATLAGWTVADLDAVVAELDSKGVKFERYEDMNPDDSGIHVLSDSRVAWFRDPDGNTFGLVEERS